MKEKGVPVVTVFLIIIVCLSIGYFMLFKSGIKLTNEKTKIKENTWKINIKVLDEEFKDSNSDIKISNTEVKIKGQLDNKDSIIKYVLEINNKGTIDANLYSIVNSNEDLDISISDGDENLKEGTIIKSKDSKKIELTIKSNKEEKLEFENDLKLIFNQYNN